MGLESIIQKIPWQKGRQETGYKKLPLLVSQTLKCDSYLVYYPEGSEIPPHTDPVDTYKHYRVNIVLKKAKEGGILSVENPVFNKYRVCIFRPDQSQHSVSKIEKGYRLLFSFGWIKKKS